MMNESSSLPSSASSLPQALAATSLESSGFDQSIDGSGYTVIESVVIAVVAGLLSFLTIAGNVLVMVSFKLDKQLQTISNYFLLSLAGQLNCSISRNSF